MATVLIVDDEEGFRHILQIVLQRAGYQTLTANDAPSALAIIETQTPNLVVLDDMMPGMSGSELCIQLKKDARYCSIPILMHSANSKLHNPAFVESIGADGVLLKPCPPREIVEAINLFLQVKT